MAKKGETTSKSVGAKASSVLRSPDTGPKSKVVAGSALSQRQPGKTTSTPAAKVASQVLRDGRTSAASKASAASALTQKPSKKK